ncbi:hypothetical protein D3C72_2410370 [compost metagenome]
MRREQIVGQGFPVGEGQYRQLRRKKTQLLLEPVSALAVGGQQQGEAFGGAGSFGDGQAQGGARQVAPGLFTGSGRQVR